MRNVNTFFSVKKLGAFVGNIPDHDGNNLKLAHSMASVQFQGFQWIFTDDIKFNVK